jgi:hypothetical protein
MGAQKLYISAHSSQESQAFYKAMGCVEAMEYNKRLVSEEPCDCQLEYNLQETKTRLWLFHRAVNSEVINRVMVLLNALTSCI